MIEIRKADERNSEVLALLGRVTYAESHGHFIEDKNDLIHYLTSAFSVSQIKKEVEDANNLIYIVYSNDLPVGYAKLELNTPCEHTNSKNSCKLERIYILNDFIHLKVGQQLLDFLDKKAKDLHYETMWLNVYIKNTRAIRFYQKNDFERVGELEFFVNGKGYPNIIFAKRIKNSENF